MQHRAEAEQYTGRYLLPVRGPMMGRLGVDGQAAIAAYRALVNHAGFNLFSSCERDVREGSADAKLFARLGLVVARMDPDQLEAVSRAATDPSFALGRPERERVLYSVGFADADDLTWGLQAVGVRPSTATGAGVRVAVLDTGIDRSHADLRGREVTTHSVVADEDHADGHGHGTHCAGTAVSGGEGLGRPRYGVAPGADLLTCKVLDRFGRGSDGDVLAGVEWALQQRADVISMSLGADVCPGEPHSAVWEAAARACLDSGTLIVAAAGNAGDAPVNSPGNCPSVLAVAALDARLQRARFSCTGPEVGIAAPGVGVFSSVPGGYASWAGTSMATPHVAGCAALWAQATGLRGRALWAALVAQARGLGLPVEHVGAGLVQVPA